MEFVHTTYVPGETIAAIATPPGSGGVAIIRISGNDALAVAKKVFSGPVDTYLTHTAHTGKIYNAGGEKIDDVLLLVMLGKRSYTGETTVEIHCHGGSLISRRVLDAVLQAGARGAEPGEFTFRAFLNGKMDLAQAEAVQELIGAKNERALAAAGCQLEGALTKQIAAAQSSLTRLTAILEAWVDFPEEGLEFMSMEELKAQLKSVQNNLSALAATFHDGKILHDGLSLCLVGCPNVGKSSLMNALLGKERAITSSIPGTTRDVLEDHLRIGGLHFKLSDTAGIRESDESIEQEGIRRSKHTMERADLVLCLFDAHAGLTEDDKKLLPLLPPSKTIIVWNKIDLPHASLPPLSFPHVAFVSAKERQGLDLLHKEIDALIWKAGPPSKEEVIITNVRHKQAIEDAVQAIDLVLDGLSRDVSPEFLTLDMRSSLQSLGKILGVNVGEEILSSIFSQFCIGK